MSIAFEDEDIIRGYSARCENRQYLLMSATMKLVEYFVSEGDDEATANNKVSQVSTEVAPFLYAYVLGNKQVLIDAINNSVLAFMTSTVKAKLIQDLQTK
jgi:hypothetical protein